jgi:hypothetical protein
VYDEQVDEVKQLVVTDELLEKIELKDAMLYEIVAVITTLVDEQVELEMNVLDEVEDEVEVQMNINLDAIHLDVLDVLLLE